jgi:hypothetical protein
MHASLLKRDEGSYRYNITSKTSLTSKMTYWNFVLKNEKLKWFKICHWIPLLDACCFLELKNNMVHWRLVIIKRFWLCHGALAISDWESTFTQVVFLTQYNLMEWQVVHLCKINIKMSFQIPHTKSFTSLYTDMFYFNLIILNSTTFLWLFLL